MRPPPRSRAPILALAAALICAPSAVSAETESLHSRLGGQPAVVRVVDELIETYRDDPKSAHLFGKVNFKRLKQKLSEQLCAVTGGPCTFDGDDMKTTHAGLPITEADFYGLVERLRVILDRHSIGTREKNELLALLAPMKRDVVTQ
jgi:hemoglobin